MHRSHPRADLRRAARAVARMRARLLVLAPPPIEHGEQAFGERGGHVLAQAERRRGLALTQQANALAHAAPQLLNVENAGRVALRFVAEPPPATAFRQCRYPYESASQSACTPSRISRSGLASGAGRLENFLEYSFCTKLTGPRKSSRILSRSAGAML